MDEIIYEKNQFQFYLEVSYLECDETEVPDSEASVPLEVVFKSRVLHYAFDHSSATFDPAKDFVSCDYKKTICGCCDLRMLSSSTEILSKSMSAANPDIKPGSDFHDEIVNKIVRVVNRYSESQYIDWIKLLKVKVEITEQVLDRCECEECRAIRESILMAEREAEKLIVPASESSIKKLLKRVRVVAADLEEGHEGRQRKRRSRGSKSDNNVVARPSDSDCCIVCSDEFTAGKYAVQMPCLHSFHRSCIEKWLRRSHHCPICRYEMPVADVQEDVETLLSS
ncbi:putative aminoacyltransferase, E1 ubiquitin-activating enzyme [Rosa chinensis]|uniref:RING-type E3 ubiquitin transferase n=2 Tax=Rosa chinensis TaxID=74649 RepID=A0A2P6S4L3_ROSCH|nr:putative aminoacyltransferase, E1 ubiquitin-activating enzyme [Rosa chinensis]